MASDYQAICIDNIRRRGEEFDDIGRLISQQIYSDRTHFIYELLQNAEDALGRRLQTNPQSTLPTSVRFFLYKDRLEFRHFGEIFTTEDVKGVSDVLKGTKRGSGDQIGRHGIGFKSVYAFTASPEIHSGSEHFIIERYIRPRCADQTPQMVEGETVFIFPFNHDEHPGEEAFRLIGDKLKVLTARVLLFLKNISRVDWLIRDSDSGFLTRESLELSKTTHRITLRGSRQTKQEKWLVFSRKISLSSSTDKYLLEIAFRLIEDERSGKQKILKIVRSPLVVYFPTKLDTHLGFLIQGPYDTVASRSDIENNKTNETLIKETALLLTEQALPELKQMGLLTVSLLEAMPIRMDEFREDDMFTPIADAVRDVFITQELLPTDDGIFVSAQNAKLARDAGLRKLLDQNHLRTLFGVSSDVRWLPGDITRGKAPDLRTYLLDELDVDEVTPEVFVRKVSGHFFREQSDEWMVSFYKYIGSSQQALWKPALGRWSSAGPLRSKPFVRLQDGSHVKPFRDDDSPNVYLTNGSYTETSLPIVKIELSQHEEVCSFFKKLGIPELDLVEEVIEKVLPKYGEDSPVITTDEHGRDISKIKKAYATDSQEKKTRLKEKLRSTPFIKVSSSSDAETIYKIPEELYFENDRLIIYFPEEDSGKFISSDYSDNTKILLGELGVAKQIRIFSKSKPGLAGNISLVYHNGCHRRGLDGFDPETHVDGLQSALANLTLEKSSFIWNEIARPYSHCIKGKVLLSSRQEFTPDASTYEEKEMVSDFGQLLLRASWLPDKDGEYYKPSDLTLDDLPSSFIRDERLANQLNMRKDVSEELLSQAGISHDTFRLAQELEKQPLEIQKQINALLKEQRIKIPVFPTGQAANPEDRKKRVRKRYDQSENKEYEKKERNVKISGPSEDPKEWLKILYTNYDNILVCQMCKTAMPFKLKDGSYHFEAVQIDDRFKNEWHELYLAMCPNCAAMYRFIVKKNEAMIDNFLENLSKDDGTYQVPVKLGINGTSSISFVEKHLNDIILCLTDSRE